MSDRLTHKSANLPRSTEPYYPEPQEGLTPKYNTKSRIRNSFSTTTLDFEEKVSAFEIKQRALLLWGVRE